MLVRPPASSTDACATSPSIRSARYSSVAYCEPNEVAAWTLSSACSDTLSSFAVNKTFAVEDGGPFSNNAGFAYLGVDSARELVIASFKGSNDTADWIQDFIGGEFDFSSCALLSGASVGTVHSGFCKYYVDLAKLGLAADFVALSRAHPTFRAVSTGHSLGATAAVLLAYDAYALSGGDVVPTLYTYGQPRVGDYSFSQELASRVATSYRLTHWRDTVPHLPLECPFGVKLRSCPYHAATEIFYVEDSSSYTVCDGSGEDGSCSDQFVVDYVVSDHCSYLESSIGSICGTCCA